MTSMVVDMATSLAFLEKVGSYEEPKNSHVSFVKLLHLLKQAVRPSLGFNIFSTMLLCLSLAQ